MPKLTTQVPRYRKHKASGQAVVSIGGQQIYLGPHGTRASRNEYDRVIGEYLENQRTGRIAKSQREATVVQVIAAYWKHAKRYYVKNGKPTSEVALIRLSLRPVRRLYGPKLASEFGPLALKAIRREWIDAGHVVSTINANVARIVRAFRWAASEELIDESVHRALATVDGLSKARGEAKVNPPVQPIDDAIVNRTTEHLCPVVRDMILLQRYTGCRPHEVCEIRPCDIDRSCDVWEYRPERHKTEHHGKRRAVQIGPKAQAVLAAYLMREPELYCFSPIEAVEQQRQSASVRRVTPHNAGNARGRNSNGAKGKRAKRPPRDKYDTESYRRAIHRGCDIAFPPPEHLRPRESETKKAFRQRLTKAERDELANWQADHRWSPNRIRHTRGTEIRKTDGLEGAQVSLGHTSAAVTEIYAERDCELARKVARKSG